MKNRIIFLSILVTAVYQSSCDDSTNSKVENIAVKLVVYRDADTSLIDTLYLSDIPHISMKAFTHGSLSYSSSLNVITTSSQANDSSYVVLLMKNDTPTFPNSYLDGFALLVGSGVYRAIAGDANFNGSGYGFQIDGFGKPAYTNIYINASGDTELALDIVPNNPLQSRTAEFEFYGLPDSSTINLSILERSNADMVVVTQINSDVFLGPNLNYGYLRPETTIRFFGFIPAF